MVTSVTLYALDLEPLSRWWRGQVDESSLPSPPGSIYPSRGQIRPNHLPPGQLWSVLKPPPQNSPNQIVYAPLHHMTEPLWPLFFSPVPNIWNSKAYPDVLLILSRWETPLVYRRMRISSASCVFLFLLVAEHLTLTVDQDWTDHCPVKISSQLHGHSFTSKNLTGSCLFRSTLLTLFGWHLHHCPCYTGPQIPPGIGIPLPFLTNWPPKRTSPVCSWSLHWKTLSSVYSKG